VALAVSPQSRVFLLYLYFSLFTALFHVMSQESVQITKCAFQPWSCEKKFAYDIQINILSNWYSIVLPLIDIKVKESCTLRELQLENLPSGSSAMPRFPSGGRLATDSVHSPVCDNIEFCLKEIYCCTKWVFLGIFFFCWIFLPVIGPSISDWTICQIFMIFGIGVPYKNLLSNHEFYENRMFLLL
jgi:hypothetical protein